MKKKKTNKLKFHMKDDIKQEKDELLTMLQTHR